MNCLVVDDEPIALEGMAEYVKQTPFLNLVATAENALEAILFLSKNPVDLIFLDINMPELTGVDMLKSLAKPPMVIFATANPNYALEGYELNVVDYLLKPISYPKFLKASQKAYKLYQLQQNLSDKTDEPLFVKVNKELIKIKPSDIEYIEGLKDYITIKVTDNEYITYLTLSKILESLPNNQFLQVHKSFIVNTNCVEKIIGNQLLIGKKTIPIGRTHKQKVVSAILEGKVIKK